jgi:hypothetical protein
MSASWVPGECYDDEITSEFRKHGGPWKFYLNTSDFIFDAHLRLPPDSEQLVLLPNENAVSEAEMVWANRHYHLMHCLFLLRRVHRALEGGSKLDSHLLEYHHSAHCSDMVERSIGTSEIPLDLVMTLTVIGYPDC